MRRRATGVPHTPLTRLPHPHSRQPEPVVEIFPAPHTARGSCGRTVPAYCRMPPVRPQSYLGWISEDDSQSPILAPRRRRESECALSLGACRAAPAERTGDPNAGRFAGWPFIALPAAASESHSPSKGSGWGPAGESPAGGADGSTAHADGTPVCVSGSDTLSAV